MDERDRLDRAAGWNAGKPGGRDLAHLPVDRGEDVAHGVRVAVDRAVQKLGDLDGLVRSAWGSRTRAGGGPGPGQKSAETRGGLRPAFAAVPPKAIHNNRLDPNPEVRT